MEDFWFADNYKPCQNQNELNFVCDCPSFEISCTQKEIKTFDVLFPLPNGLEVLDLSRNEIASLETNPNQIWNQNVKEIDFSRNEISKVDERFFANLTSLKRLDLSHNQLITLEAFIFQDLINLESLQLSHNLFIHINSNWFTHTSSLFRLDVSFNPLGTVKTDFSKY